ncbi:MAG: hypothetical protein ACXAD7_04045 [Candidatus Kariarchaeaceae archaeon]|jgi:hypothetical protein
MSTRKYCNELLEVINVIENGLRAPLENISQITLNHVFAPHKMTIGQLAVHCTAWGQYFMADEDNKPWEVEKWTCIPCEYPLTLQFVNQVMSNGFNAMRDKLNSIDDSKLDLHNGERGPGYILCRLQLHALSHANQMAYLRQLLDPEWVWGGWFGDMASAYIKMSYHTDRDLQVPGF